jgi:hypothetical protein
MYKQVDEDLERGQEFVKSVASFALQQHTLLDHYGFFNRRAQHEAHPAILLRRVLSSDRVLRIWAEHIKVQSMVGGKGQDRVSAVIWRSVQDFFSP